MKDDEKDISVIDGVGPKSAEAFNKVGITTVEQLLAECSSEDAIARCAEATGLSEKSIQGWVEQAKTLGN